VTNLAVPRRSDLPARILLLMRKATWTRIGRVLAGLAAVALITAAFATLTSINLPTAGFVYLITILLIAARWGLAEAAAASIAAAFCLNYFFVMPIGTLHIASFDDWVALAAFLVTSLVASHLSELARRRNTQLEQRQIEMERLYEMNRSAEAARQSEKFKATLLDAVAHEFKTPLTSIKAATSTILTSPSITEEQREELLTIVGQETERLSRLMKEMFHLARVESGKLHLLRTRQNIPELVAEAVRQTPNLNGKPIQTTYAPLLPAADLDSELFVVALKQLVDNAAKYSPNGTPVRITADASPDSLWIRVHNQGRWLSESERTRVFERFYRSPETSQGVAGTGIGLSIARDIVMAHGGYIDVESGPGMGTEFSIRLPLRKESAS
jgi:K+-sensing histidine kinase KdpD